MKQTITALDVSLYIREVGISNASYYIVTFFYLDIATNTVTWKCSVDKNFYTGQRIDGLFAGTAEECASFIDELVKQQEVAP